MSAPSTVAVRIAVCTYRRPHELARLLPQLLLQAADVAREGHQVDLLVVDNDASPGVAAGVAGGIDHRIVCLHEPTPGISAARNAAIDASGDRRLLAFIDDDEEPHPDWLPALVRTWQSTGAAAVSGRVVARFEAPADPWLLAGGFFVRRNLTTGTDIDVAAAGNLLLDLDQVRRHGVRFDERFGLTGGEDTLFSRQLHRCGGRMVWCAESVVTDVVPAQRATRDWVLTRARQHGRTATRVHLALSGSTAERGWVRVRQALRGAGLITLGSGRAATGSIRHDPVRHATGLRRVQRGRGLLEGLFGAGTAAYGREVRVLQSFPEPRATTNPYLVLLARSLDARDHVRVQTFSWRTALFGRYDVFHVHWPEILVGGRTRPGALLRQALFLALLVRLRVGRRPLVRTQHNLALPEGLNRRQVLLLRLLDRWTDGYVRLTELTPTRPDVPVQTIPHGDYRGWYAQQQRRPSRPGRIAYVGQVRRYKGVEQLLGAFVALPDPALTLHVAGRPSSSAIADRVRALATVDSRVRLHLEHLTDEDLVAAVTSAELVVLPYRAMHNSGVVIAALSLERPVLVPDNEVNRSLRQECGPAWVHLYSGGLTAQSLADALRQLRRDPPGRPPALERRDWAEAARAHEHLYRRALARTGRGQDPAPLPSAGPAAEAASAPAGQETASGVGHPVGAS